LPYRQANLIDPVDVAGNRQSSSKTLMRMVEPGAPFETPNY